MLQWWSEEDREILNELYPSATKDKILKALNGQYRKKTWPAIQKEASRLGIKREIKSPGRPRKRPKHFLGKKQLAKLLEKEFTVIEIAQKLRSTPEIVRRYIHKYGL